MGKRVKDKKRGLNGRLWKIGPKTGKEDLMESYGKIGPKKRKEE